MNKWIILLIAEDVKASYKWAMQIKSLYRSEDIDPIICSLDDSESYLRQRNVALVVFGLPYQNPSGKLSQLSSMLKFYKLDCELLVVHDKEDSQVLRAARDCGGKLFKKSDSDSTELLELLKQLIAKRTGTSYELFNISDRSARLEERLSAMQDKQTETLAKLSALNDCLFGGPKDPGWDKRLDWLEEQLGQIQLSLNQLKAEQTQELVVFKNQMGILLIRSMTRFIFRELWNWILENPLKVVGVVGAIAGVVLALFNL
ncbi:MAG: hypothetical protein RH949_13315 [Coleofasciculus sp. A1-SPW-01]|uniref:hypothetical protein n=1 Tax=Coleofasciculus sp. A1-SPW-01 TaxID=3070819 RepID=UPI0032F9D077